MHIVFTCYVASIGENDLKSPYEIQSVKGNILHRNSVTATSVIMSKCIFQNQSVDHRCIFHGRQVSDER